MKLFLVYNDYNEEAEECFRSQRKAHEDIMNGISEMVEGHGEIFKEVRVTSQPANTIIRYWYEFDDGGKIHMMTMHQTFVNMDHIAKLVSDILT